jgi:hypothetical protein
VSILLDLPRELEEELAQEAARRGLPLAEYALRVLAESRTASAADEAPLSGAELVEYWKREGIIGSRPDIEDPAAFARELRERNQNRTRS